MPRTYSGRAFKHVKGKNVTTTFLPPNNKTGGTYTNKHDDRYLTKDQVRYVHRKVKREKEINTKTLRQEVEQET